MANELEVINKVIEAHHTIKERIGKVGEAVNDLQAIIDLQRSQSTLSISPVEALSERLSQLTGMVNNLEEGLKEHFILEERVLPPILGRVLMRALILEHRGIRNQVNEVRVALAEAHTAGKSYEQLLTEKSKVQQLLKDLNWTIEDHANREDIIYKMARNGLENHVQ